MKKIFVHMIVLGVLLSVLCVSAAGYELNPVFAVNDNTVYVSAYTAYCLRKDIMAQIIGPATETNLRYHAADAEYVCSGDLLQTTTGSLRIAVIGDIDQNGRVSARDARRALLACAKGVVLTELQRNCCDFDGNGKIEASEARKVLRIAANLEFDSDVISPFAARDQTEGFEVSTQTRPADDLFDHNVLFWFYAATPGNGYSVIGFYRSDAAVPLRTYLAERGFSLGEVSW